jgi:soluble lytic murein transglycosylase-like protein
LFKLFIIGVGLLLIVFASPPPQAHAALHTPRMSAWSQYVAIAQQDAIDAGISPAYFVRQINMESGFNPRAVSRAGAIGIAQFMPGTAAALGINPWEPIQSLRSAATLMASYTRWYSGNYAMALAAYNAGHLTSQYAVNTCGSNWSNCLPYETRHYISVIMGDTGSSNSGDTGSSDD